MKKLLSFWALLFVAHFAFAQIISGSVLAENTSIVGANVYNTISKKGTTTDNVGFFELPAQKGDIIQVSFLGYKTQKFEVKDQNTYTILLYQSSTGLNEVVVTALGLERESKDLGYAVQMLEGKKVSRVKDPNFLNNLAGKVAGVTVTQGPTGVGSTARISIRGEASFTNNNPLFVVDGIPINNNTDFNFTNEKAAGFQEVDFGNGAMDINPDDVASISVLKGPSAAALYGTRASNGVIIINTKDGSKTTGLGVSFNSSTFVDRAFQLPRFQNKYGQGNSGQFQFVDGLGGGINDNITYSYGPELDTGLEITQFDTPVVLPDGTTVQASDFALTGGLPLINGNDTLPLPTSPWVSNPDNLKDFYQTGITTTNNIALSGGYDKGNYRFSFTDMNSTSIIPGVNLKRKNAAARLTFKPTKKLAFSTSINYVNAQSDNRPASGYGSENINYSLVAWMGRQTNLANLEEYWQPGFEDLQQRSFNYTFFDNPYFILNENRNAFDRDRIFGNFAASYKFNKNWTVKLRSGIDNSDEERTFRRAYSSNRFKTGAYAEHEIGFREVNTDFLVNYRKDYADFSMDLSAGGNRMDQRASTKQSQALSLAQAGVFSLSNAASPIEVFQAGGRKRINSFYALAKFGYKNYLFVEATGRNDWSSALATPNGSENTSFFYPSFSGSLVLSNLVDIADEISFMKFRAGWAQVGNDTGPYQTAGVFQSQTPFNGQPTFSDQNTIANNNLLPEQTSSVELGLDVRFFGDRLKLDLTYYNAITENQILALPTPISSGYTQQVVNGGAVRSEGVEVIVGYTPILKDKFVWNTFFNFNTNKTTVEELPDGADRLTLGYSRVYDNSNQTVWQIVEEGDQIGELWGTGHLKTDGGQFILDQNGALIADNELKRLGNSNPDFILGMANQIEYKNWNLGFNFEWRYGGILVSRTLSLAGVGGQLEETENRPAEGIIIPGVVNNGSDAEPQYSPNTTPISAEAYYRSFYDRNHEENNVYSASFLKMRDFSIGYTFPAVKLKDGALKNFSGLRIALIGRNLFAISEIPHFDPEQFAVQGNSIIGGVEDLSYATTRSIGVSFGLDF